MIYKQWHTTWTLQQDNIKWPYLVHKQNQCQCVGNHIQMVKIVINDNIIKQVTDFKYLGHRISEYEVI